MSKLQVKNLVKSYSNDNIVNDVSFTVEDGELLTFLGPSGCGKTTILKLITGLEKEDSGEILVDGQNITNMPTEKRNISMVFQNYALFEHMNVFSNVAFGLKIRHFSKNEIKAKVEEALSLVQMTDYSKRKVTELSGGQQQRVALARALVVEPDILLLDEPLSALDKKIRVEMQKEIRLIQQKLGITTIFVTHDQEEAMTVSDKIILFNHGQIEQYDTPKNIYENPSNVFVSDFLGKSNILNGTVNFYDDKSYVEGSGFKFPVETALENGTPVDVSIRGENIKLSINGDSHCWLIKSMTYIGSLMKLEIMNGDNTLEVMMMSREAENFRVTQKVSIQVDKKYIKLFVKK